MINIKNKKDCTGCCACVDICSHKAISLSVDNEGFWYPKVDESLCVDCGLCDKVCPELHVKEVNATNKETPTCFAAQHKDEAIRLDSTSGGLFSALANMMYDQGGYVAGAIYNEDFSVRHIISNDRKDLEKIRSSKYLQSSCVDLYKAIKKLLVKNEKVLVCGCPCQMSALRLYLGKEYEQLIICDFICLGINSPKIFRKHLDSLESKYNSKIIYAKAKNKEHGWRSLTFKAMFENGKSYYGSGSVDNFTRGYLRTGSYCRPSCYECNYKQVPRIADITLADFWGIENVDKSLDDNTGTSLVMCNSEKGKLFFESIQSDLKYREVDIESIKPGNRALFNSIQPRIDRDVFFEEVDKLPYNEVANKLFPFVNESVYLNRFKRVVKNLLRITWTIGFHPKVWCQFIWLNLLRKNTHSNILKGHVLIPSTYTVLDLHKDAKITVDQFVIIGFKKVRGSHLETRIRMDNNTSLHIKDVFTFYSGGDIQIFPNGNLVIDGGPGAGCNINCQIVCANNIHIGKSVLVGRNVVIRDYDAHYILQKGYKISAPITIGDHCWIGEGAMISKGVKIAFGSIVAARSWVIGKVKSKTIVAGSPASVVDEEIEWKQ